MAALKEKPRILIVEGNLSLQRSIAYILEKEGFNVICADSGKEAIELARKKYPDLILLDLVLPGIDAFGVCEALKRDSQTENILVILLTEKGMVDDTVRGLELYADDFINKPFEPRILIALIRAVLRRKVRFTTGEESLLQFDDLTIDLKGYAVRVDGENVELTKTEFEIIALLAGRYNQVFTRARILEHVRADCLSITERVVDYQITGLRKKLGRAGEYVKTVRGVGYKFEV